MMSRFFYLIVLGLVMTPGILDAQETEILYAKADSILARLNDWDQDELEHYERPQLDPDRVTSGETNGWIETGKAELKELGVLVVWNNELRRYDFAEPLNILPAKLEEVPDPSTGLTMIALATDTSSLLNKCDCNEAIIRLMKDQISLLERLTTGLDSREDTLLLNDAYTKRLDKYFEVYKRCQRIYQKERYDSCPNDREGNELDRELNALLKKNGLR